MRTPNVARMYDYFLGGKDNHEWDRVAADEVNAVMGQDLTGAVVWENRQFLIRAVRFLVGACGVRQIIDVGSGLPTQMNTHQVAHGIDPGVRVVYVDSDPVVLAHGRALLADNDRTTVITADMRNPGEVLGHRDVSRMIDFGEPVAVLFVAVCHFIRDDEHPGVMVGRFRDAIGPGSYVVLSHLTTDGPPAGQVKAVEAAYESATSPMVFRSRDAIAGLFTGLDLVDPGRLVRPWQWHTDDAANARTQWLYAAIGRKP